MDDPTSRFLTTADLANRWRTSAKSIGNMRHRGFTPPAVRLGGRVLYRLSDVIAFENERAESGNAAS